MRNLSFLMSTVVIIEISFATRNIRMVQSFNILKSFDHYDDKPRRNEFPISSFDFKISIINKK